MTICNIKAYQVVFDKYKNSKKLTTNNAESINNIMKLDSNWKPHSTDKSFGRHYQTPATGPPACAVEQWKS